MDIEFLSAGLRLFLWIVIALGVLAGAGLAWVKRTRLAAIVAIGCAMAGLVFVIEALAAFLVHRVAPHTTDFNEFRWVFLAPWSQTALVIGGIAGTGIVFLTAFSTRKIHNPWRWSTVVGLRTAAVVTALVLFLQPAIELRQVAREPNRIALLVDDSQSMELADQGEGHTRRDLVKDILAASESTFAHWQISHLIDVYHFSDTLTATGLKSVGTAPSTGKATLLRQALEQLRRRYEGDDLAGIIVMSDGAVNGDLAEIGAGEFRDFVQELDVPVHTVWAAKEGLKDRAVTEVRADEFAYIRTVTRIEAIIRSTGFARKRIPVTLSGDGKDMRRKWIEIGPGKAVASVVFEFTPSHVGKFVYQVSVPTEDEEIVVENNSARFVIRVIRDKIRVLQVAGQPSWDVRALRGMLKQNANVDLISFFILRTPDDIRTAGNDELSLIPFPTRELFEEELPSFDLVVLQNFNYGPYGIGRYLENIRSYVRGGGGMMMLGGPLSFASGGYSNTPVAKALPVELPSRQSAPDELIDSKPYRAKLTDLGRIHPVTALRYEADDNASQWKTLPLLQGINKILRAKKTASVLAVHPTLKDSTGSPMPLIVAGDYGNGRSLAVATDSLWRWGFIAAAKPGNDGRHYLKLWDNAIRWLIQDPELRHLHVDSDRNTYNPGDIVRLHLRVLDQDYSPLANSVVKLVIEQGFDPQDLTPIESVQVTVGETGEGKHEIGTNLSPGVYRVRAESTVRDRQVHAEDIFLVREASNERMHPDADDTTLTMLSQLSNGRFLGAIDSLPEDLDFVAPKIVRVDKRSDVPLWNGSWLLLCALGFLGLEWLLRQRSGTL